MTFGCPTRLPGEPDRRRCLEFCHQRASPKPRRFPLVPLRDKLAAVRRAFSRLPAALLFSVLVSSVSAVAAETNLPSASGEYLIRQWTSNDGLPQNSVIAMTQTMDGYLWLATFGGLARFDGVRFEVFDPDRVRGLESYYLYLAPDRENGLWLSRSDGPASHYSDGKFRRLTEADGLPAGRASRLQVAPDGTVWAGSMDGRLFRRSGGKFAEAAPAPEPDWGHMWNFVFDQEGTVWCETRGRLRRWNGSRWDRLELPAAGIASSSIFPNGDGSTLLLDRHSGVMHRWSAGTLSRHFAAPGNIGKTGSPMRTSNGTFWFLSAGIFRRHPQTGSWSTVAEDTALAHTTYRSMFEDREGSLWLGTDGAGLFRLRQRSVQAMPTATSATHPIVLSVSGNADGTVFVAVHGRGVHRYAGDRFTQLQLSPALDERLLAWCLQASPQGGAWIGTYGQGVVHLAPDGASARQFAPDQIPGLLDGPHGAVLVDSQQQVWIGGDQGLCRLVGEQVRLWTSTNGLPKHPIEAIAEAGNGGVWVGGNLGLTRLEEGNVRTFTKADGLAHDHARSLFRDADGTLWIGGGGLTRYKAGRFSAIRETDGLPVETVKSLVADNLGYLWWGTPRGVFRCAKAELDDFCEGRRQRIEPTRFDLADGMPSNECSGYQSGVWKGPDGRLWFATMNGVAVIDPTNLPKNPVAPPVVIEAVTADGKVCGAIAGRVTVPPGTLLTEFRFTALSFVAPERNRFRCRLVGYEEEFREVGTARFAAYTRLRPGSYHLRVIAANNDGLWNETGATLAVTVAPFLWETLAFRTTVGAFALLFLALGVRWLSQRRLRLQVAELERDQAVNRERARIARNMHDDVGASLTQIGLLSELARRQLKDPAATESRLNELGDLSRDVVRNLDAMVWTVDPEHDTVAGLVEYIAGFAQEYVAPAGWACRLDLPPQLPDDPVPAATRHHVLLLVKEALNNALKHSGATEVTVRAKVEGSTLRLELADNGRGFDPATAGRFNDGLGNMRERARQAGGRCEIASAAGAGTRVVLTLPLK